MLSLMGGRAMKQLDAFDYFAAIMYANAMTVMIFSGEWLWLGFVILAYLMYERAAVWERNQREDDE